MTLYDSFHDYLEHLHNELDTYWLYRSGGLIPRIGPPCIPVDT